MIFILALASSRGVGTAVAFKIALEKASPCRI
jgi:hypothetical protein